MNRYRLLALLALVLFAAGLRFLPQPPNFTPVLALALFSGVFFPGRLTAIAVPLLVMLITDIFVGFHNTMPFVYGSFILMVLMGRSLRFRVSPGYIAGGGISGSMLFFVITNFGVWLTSPLYPRSLEGLWAAYIAAIPFLHYMIISTLLYSALFFGLFLWAQKTVPLFADQSEGAGV